MIPPGVPSQGPCDRAERESCKDQAEVLPSALVTPLLHPDPQLDRIQVPDRWGMGSHHLGEALVSCPVQVPGDQLALTVLQTGPG